MRINIRFKLLGAFAAILLLTAIVGYIGFSSANQINTMLDTMYQNHLQGLMDVKDATLNLYTIRISIRSAVLAPDAGAVQSEVAKIQTSKTEFESDMAAYEKTILSDQDREAYQQTMEEYQAYITEIDTILRYIDQGDTAQAIQAIQNAAAITQSILTSMDDLVASKEILAADFNRQSDVIYTQSRNWIIGLTLTAIALGLGIAFLVAQAISKSARQMAAVAEGISNGVLDQRISVTSKDEMGDMAASFTRMIAYLQNMAGVAQKMASGDLTEDVAPKSSQDVLGNAFKEMIESLRKMAGEVAASASSLGTASQQLASAAAQAGQATNQIATTIQQVASGITQQSESVTRTAVTVEQMAQITGGVAQGAQDQAKAVGKAAEITNDLSTAIQQVSTAAKAVSSGSSEATRSAEDGVRTVQETITGMHTIQSKVGISSEKVAEMGLRSDQIGVIVEAIEDIASQTNLLALNAAIEAARAGEHGKGFAVVADEVRKLAERASSSTKEIGVLIKGIQQTVTEAVAAMEEGAREVKAGVEQANLAGEALESILKAAQTVNDQAEKATEAANQMDRLSAELVVATDSVSSVVEENTAATEEMSAGANEVNQSIENIASISEENSAAVEEVSASAEEMSAQVEEVTASAQSLAEMAGRLQQIVGQFKLPAG